MRLQLPVCADGDRNILRRHRWVAHWREARLIHCHWRRLQLRLPVRLQLPVCADGDRNILRRH